MSSIIGATTPQSNNTKKFTISTRANVRVVSCIKGQVKINRNCISCASAKNNSNLSIDQLKKLKVITAIKTPYHPSGKFDLKTYDNIVQHQIENGVEGIVVGGTTGEGHLMSWDEHVMLIAHTVNSFGEKIAVIGNTGSNSTREALHATEQGFAVGMDAALQINPYYGKTSKSGLLRHFRSVLKEGPAIIYNVPGRTGQDIPDDVIFSVADSPNFLGVKECTGNKRIQNYTSKGVNCWSGNDDEAHDARHLHGAAGVISVTSNVIPKLVHNLMASPQPELNKSLQELMGWLFCEPNPISLNTTLSMCGLIQPVFRLPYVPLSLEQRQRGAKLLRDVKEFIPGCKEINILDDKDFILI
nr:4-hydroxy-tetrahydrodipicolinate synthase (DAPA) [Polytomella parva]|mmetsp:Transcript_12080/g.21650  ORF Transcript_12080/g.21650 Transcript_12080/m.21650 type:complete len:357 (-) Transcript_12080:77-1147(-)|eukprot:CAMPEP_0175057364 /NCGR_PEP_ID=MMETSP0052_2-20121109/11222_1 /TAXON_ID=51329 ORGANISM="Polytomella parva, Strain SAG 63-3" /NCGR_SAMPLE_ID=MMETSP0052_2 /ASSEMBLY_ACC=CAM_ASM_000194 /LENGTH=356 /DNA_ID=CAMNT_0016322567 /DNA_START=89 /DNA_END=1159 /DNA_ORIENTATION=-